MCKFRWHLFHVYVYFGAECSLHKTIELPFVPYFNLQIDTPDDSFPILNGSVSIIHYDTTRNEFIIDSREDVTRRSLASFMEEIARNKARGWKVFDKSSLTEVIKRIREKENV